MTNRSSNIKKIPQSQIKPLFIEWLFICSQGIELITLGL